MAGRVVVAGLGPAGPELITAGTLACIERIPHRHLRTSRHPAAASVPGAASFDYLYEEAATLEEVYSAIVERLVSAADEHGEVLYLVPGSPTVAERSVELLRRDGRSTVQVLPAASFLDLAWAHAGDPAATSPRLVDGHRFAKEAAGERGPLLVLQCDSRRVLSDIKLAVEDGPASVTVLQRLGLPEEAVFEVPWDELDRSVVPDHLTSIWIPVLAAPVAMELARFVELVAELRRRCPWDREQTHQSLARHLLEETYETLEAIEGLTGPDGPAHLEEELGDLLFQVCFHATLAAEEGWFTLSDVAGSVHEKLVGRHSHVFGSPGDDTSGARTAGEVMANWERAKVEEKGRHSIMEGVPSALPALLHALKVQRRAAGEGFDWDCVEGAYEKVSEELAEVRADPSDKELGDLLFAVVNVARHLDLDPEAALRGASAKFRDRFMAVERLAARQGADLRSLGLACLDRLWDEVKRDELERDELDLAVGQQDVAVGPQ
ncbi:MAG: nucleoside triphosphate pyrophosphohydrolase [Actinomycetota bacterium]|nr:nucleoside triphosphate pyrophosphohydrolase [Actinomycetota bacterium]